MLFNPSVQPIRGMRKFVRECVRFGVSRPGQAEAFEIIAKPGPTWRRSRFFLDPRSRNSSIGVAERPRPAPTRSSGRSRPGRHGSPEIEAGSWLGPPCRPSRRDGTGDRRDTGPSALFLQPVPSTFDPARMSDVQRLPNNRAARSEGGSLRGGHTRGQLARAILRGEAAQNQSGCHPPWQSWRCPSSPLEWTRWRFGGRPPGRTGRAARSPAPFGYDDRTRQDRLCDSGGRGPRRAQDGPRPGPRAPRREDRPEGGRTLGGAPDWDFEVGVRQKEHEETR
jgi:hypothetical protein